MLDSEYPKRWCRRKKCRYYYCLFVNYLFKQYWIVRFIFRDSTNSNCAGKFATVSCLPLWQWPITAEVTITLPRDTCPSWDRRQLHCDANHIGGGPPGAGTRTRDAGHREKHPLGPLVGDLPISRLFVQSYASCPVEFIRKFVSISTA